MNVLDKIKIVQNGLNCCGSDCSTCSKCPYNDRDRCRKGLIREADEIIKALRDELKKKTSKAVETKSGFIMLTQWSSTKALQKRVAIMINDILYVSDLSGDEHCGSNIRLKGEDGFTIVVAESIEEILSKISESKGEKENERAGQD